MPWSRPPYRPMLPHRPRRIPLAESCESRLLLAATLVADLNTDPASSNPQHITDVGGTAFFSAVSPATGAELWKSDGTAAGTVLVRDVAPGVFGSAPASLVDLNGTLLFSAFSSGRRIWRSDGTAAGTVQVSDAVSVGADSTAGRESDLVRHGDVVFFRGRQGPSDVELWRTDGTAAGTYRVKDIRPGPEGSNPSGLISVGDRLFFTAYDDVHGREWWVTDGTEAGTRRITDIGVDAFSVAAGDRLYSVTPDTYPSSVVWSTDGTEQGIVRILSTADGFIQMAPLGDKMLILDEGRNRQRVLISDGTAAGTVELKHFDTYFGTLDNPIVGDGVVYFVRSSYSEQVYELWKTDGTAAGTVAFDTLAARLKLFAGNRLFFTAPPDGAGGVELWSTDGTPGGAALAKDIAPGPASSDPQEFAEVGGVAFFTADTPGTGRELWRSDGTPAGTYLVKDINPATGGSGPHGLADADGTLFVTAGPNDARQRLFKAGADGRLEPVPFRPLARPGFWPEMIMTASGGLAYFTTYPPNDLDGIALNRSDGSAEGTFRLTPYGDWALGPMLDLDGRGTVLFSMERAELPDQELWRTDGTVQGTVLVKDINPGFPASDPAPFATLPGGFALLAATTRDAGRELWRTDGTADGTVLVKDIVPGPAGSDPRPVAVVNGLAYFRVTAAGGAVELWKSDGTDAGTVRVAAVGDGGHRVGYGSVEDVPPVGAAIGSLLVFSAIDPAGGMDLWRSDGSEAGTYRIKDDLAPTSLVAYAGKVYFAGNDGDAGTELWATDGTEAGTARSPTSGPDRLAPRRKG